MGRWIAFDNDTAGAISSSLPGSTAELQTGNVLQMTLDQGGAALLPAADGQVLVVEVRRNTLAAPLLTASTARAYEAGGFLGLRDEPIYDEEAPQPKKWWQKILG